MFLQQKITGESVLWMVFAHQEGAVVRAPQCFRQGVETSAVRMGSEERPGSRLCAVDGGDFIFPLKIAPVILPVCLFPLQNSGWCSTRLRPGGPGVADNSNLQENTDHRGPKPRCECTAIPRGAECGLVVFWGLLVTHRTCSGSQLPLGGLTLSVNA